MDISDICDQYAGLLDLVQLELNSPGSVLGEGSLLGYALRQYRDGASKERGAA